MQRFNNQHPQKDFRINLRKSLTPAEAILWNQLKSEKLGVKFRRQHSVGKYIIDFYCTVKKLGVELDGSPHDTDIGFRKDQDRTRYLNNLGITIIRFENKEVFKNLEGVLIEIKKHLG